MSFYHLVLAGFLILARCRRRRHCLLCVAAHLTVCGGFWLG